MTPRDLPGAHGALAGALLGATAYVPPARPTLYVTLHTGRGLVARLIQWQTWSDVSHAALAVRFGDVRAYLPDVHPRTGQRWGAGVRRPHGFVDADVVLLEAREGRGVVCERRLEDVARAERVQLRAVPCSRSALVEVYAWWGQRVGVRGYDYAGVCRFLPRAGGARRDERWFCSEAVAASLGDAGVVVTRAPLAHVSPARVAESLALVPVPLATLVPDLADVDAAAGDWAGLAAPPRAGAARARDVRGSAGVSTA